MLFQGNSRYSHQNSYVEELEVKTQVKRKQLKTANYISESETFEGILHNLTLVVSENNETDPRQSLSKCIPILGSARLAKTLLQNSKAKIN
ncbi:16647_t:CDS:2 [Funneliformis caledonium]|uniref:16647_t:CDS:1 n=1 Tax=Funneliformis caledonium TaxID=1117310 RepID=A0A9N8VMN9_9GLOM|nr:16647_t:CDS:2 [Funneliformis caledonium]